MIKELKKMLRNNGLSLEEYHRLFPRLMEAKYDVDTVSLFSYHFNFAEPSFVYSDFSSLRFDEATKELETRRKVATTARVLTTSIDFNHGDRAEYGTDLYIHQHATFRFQVMVKCLKEAGLVFWFDHRKEETPYFDDFDSVAIYDPDCLQECTRTEVARKFAEVANMDVSNCRFPIETFLPELEEYLDPYDRQKKNKALKYYWVGRQTHAFLDVGIIVFDKNRDTMTYLLYVNNY